MIQRFLYLSAFTLLMFPFAAVAALPATPCAGQIGCNGGGAIQGSNVIVDHLAQLANLMILIGAALSVFFIVYAGFRMVTALGDESQISEQKNAVRYVLIGLTLVLLSQAIVSYVGTQDYGQGGVAGDLFLNLTTAGISILLTLFNAAMIISAIIGGVYMVHAQGKSDQFTKGKTIITWSIAGAIIANLSNAFVHALIKLLNIG